MSLSSAKSVITVREMDVLNVLWQTDTPLIASQIAKEIKGQTVNGVQTLLRALLKKGFIEVFDIVYSGTVLSRRYKATELSATEALKAFTTQFEDLKHCISGAKLYAALLDSEEDRENIEYLDTLVKQKKDNLPKE